MLLDNIDGPADLRRLDYPALDQLADEIRTVVVDAVNEPTAGTSAPTSARSS
ncbi:MAG: 1-deoxy-D-xylulose-5-phosphate synthase N-terminal domain-containing protein [Microthrixaceae bacterium]